MVLKDGIKDAIKMKFLLMKAFIAKEIILFFNNGKINS